MRRRSEDRTVDRDKVRWGSRAWRAATRVAFVLALLAVSLCPLRVSFAEAIDLAALLQRPSGDTRILGPSHIGSSQTPLTWQERDQLERQRERIEELARRHLGRSLSGTRLDLETMQRLLDERTLGRRDRYRLQALGVVLGDVLVSEYGYEWIAYHDELGRSRALRHAETQRIVFPVTAISRRVEAGLDVDVAEIFGKLAAAGNPDNARVFAASSRHH